MLLLDNLKMQIVGLFFLTLLIIQYRKTRRLPLLSYKYYDTIIALVIFNMALNFFAVTTEVYNFHIDEKIIRFAHQLYTLSVAALMASFFCYVESRGSRRKKNIKADVAMLLPLIVSIPVVIFAGINIYNDGMSAYVTGPMMSIIPINIFTYSLFVILDLFISKKDMPKEKKKVIISGVAMWVVATIVQMKFPYIRLATVASTLLAWILFLSFQNPQELIDDDLNAFNSRAYGMVVNEYIGMDKSFYIFHIVFTDLSAMYNLLGRDNSNKLLKKMVEDFEKKLGKLVFSVGNGALSIILNDDIDLNEVESYLKKYFKKAHKINQLSVDVNANVYVLKCPDYASTTEEIFRITQHIMDYFKNRGRDEVIYVNEEILAKTRRIEAIKAILTDAIENDGFEVMYQPIYDIKHGYFGSAEALVRLKYKGELGFISPEEYIPIAEKNGLISEIGSIVFKSVCRFASLNKLERFNVKYIEVNLSGVQAADGSISVQLKDIMDSYGIGAGFINLEITETALIDYQDILRENMEKLRAIGCTFSMDDFGTGYSNLSQLADLKYDIIKIDKSLVWSCFDGNENSDSSRIILESMVSLIQQMGARIVVEGIETEEQFEYMKQLRVDYIQGYYFSKPLNEHDYLAFVEKSKFVNH